MSYKPKVGETYYYILLSVGGTVVESIREYNDSHFKSHYANGNCFETKQKAEDDKHLIIRILKTLSK